MTRLRPYLAVILVTLPFTMGVTLPVAFPLKIYEAVGGVALVVLLAAHRVRIGRSRRVLLLWFLFLGGTLVSAAASLFLLPDVNLGPLAWAHGRFVPRINLAYNLVYLGFVLGLLLLFVHGLRAGVIMPLRFARLWLTGTVAGVAYAVLLNLLHWAGLPLWLALYRAEPQLLRLGGLAVVRNGPFLEGNYLGLYLVLSCAIGLWAVRRQPDDRWYRRVIVAILLGVVISGAPLGIAGVLGLLVLAALQPAYPAGFRRAVAVGVAVVLAVALPTDLVRVQFLEKLSLLFSGSVADHRNVSLVQRANEAYKAWLIFLDHPWLGVGVGNYGYFAGGYPDLFTWLNMDYLSHRRIPNNVYLEVLCEQGAVLGAIFVLSHGLVVRALWRRRAWILLAGCVVLLVYYLAFPTYKLAFLWVAQAFLLHVGYEDGRTAV